MTITRTDYDHLPTREPIRKSGKPVSNRHVNQRRTENGLNRFRNVRKWKETNRV